MRLRKVIAALLSTTALIGSLCRNSIRLSVDGFQPTLVDEVFGFGFPGMVRDNDRHIKVDGDFTQSDKSVVVGFIGGLRPIRPGPDLHEHIDGDERDLAASRSCLFVPFADVVEAALVGAPPLVREGDVFRPLTAEWQQFCVAELHPTLSVLQCQIEYGVRYR
jgi:hypothetical protein